MLSQSELLSLIDYCLVGNQYVDRRRCTMVEKVVSVNISRSLNGKSIAKWPCSSILQRTMIRRMNE